MSNYKATRLDEIEVLDDGRVPMLPVRHHLGITAFGVNGFTGRKAGDRLINEHDESGENDQHEELYVVVTGHARFEVGDDTVDAPQGTLVFVPPELKRTAFAEEAGTTLLAVGAAAGQAYEPAGWEIWSPFNPLYQAGTTPVWPRGAARRSRLPSIRCRCTTSPAARPSPAGRRTRSDTCARRSSAGPS